MKVGVGLVHWSRGDAHLSAFSSAPRSQQEARSARNQARDNADNAHNEADNENEAKCGEAPAHDAGHFVWFNRELVDRWKKNKA